MMDTDLSFYRKQPRGSQPQLKEYRSASLTIAEPWIHLEEARIGSGSMEMLREASTNEAAEIIANVDISSEFLQIPSNEYRTREFERDSRHLINLELHCATIAEYLKAERIPRGLRVALRPTIFKENDDFCKKFEQILNKCSHDLMTLTLDTLQKSITSVREKVHSTETQLSTSMTSDDFQSFKTKLTSTLLQHRQESEQKKRQKFLRDTEDYRNNRVHTDPEEYLPTLPTQVPTTRDFQTGEFLFKTGKKDDHQEEDKEGRTMGKERPLQQSRRDLSPPQMSLLQKGLSFCPSYKLDTFQLDMDLQKFYRSLRLKEVEDFANISPVGVNIWRVDENIIQIDYDRGGKHIPEDIIHKVLENSWGITEPEGHHQIFIVPIPGVKSRLPFVPLMDANQVALDSLIKDKELVVKPADKGIKAEQ
ncbi:unnamed protein product [Ranitomeya imitator]|uniref:Uncharacterized protein n=1 Tax=Ranitomeya imitator TaxID=111125 RepID=A0ABN9M2R8_9NEOB|nr:unnamed protein product [Ranitomeya imitator]